MGNSRFDPNPPTVKYNDEDVRRHPELREIAEMYALAYEGKFEPIVAAQTLLRQGRVIPNGGIRVVLNCMRNDMTAYSTLPEIIRDDTPAKPPKTPKYISKDCGTTEGHYGHTWRDDSEENVIFMCAGVRFKINRSGYVGMRTRIRADLMTSRSGQLVHKILKGGEGDYPHEIIWNVPQHDYGWTLNKHLFTDGGYDYFPKLSLRARPQCGKPAFIDRPIILEPERLVEMLGGTALLGYRQLCARCFSNGEHL